MYTILVIEFPLYEVILTYLFTHKYIQIYLLTILRHWNIHLISLSSLGLIHFHTA
ncbi:hypothetical protein BCN_0278 [Bacillus cereus NC7401]|nr:hypothetical protein BCN_0278 [Bacillus cereus NC7401]